MCTIVSVHVHNSEVCTIVSVHNSPSEPFCQSDPLRNPSHPLQLTPNDLEYPWLRINSSFPQSIIDCTIIKLFVLGIFYFGHIQILLFWSSWIFYLHDHLCKSFWALVKSVYLYLCTPFPLPPNPNLLTYAHYILGPNTFVMWMHITSLKPKHL